MARKSIVSTEEVATPLGQYSQAIKAGPFVYMAGQVASDFRTGIAPEARVVPGFPYYGVPIKLQTDYVLGGSGRVLAAAGSSFDQVVAAWSFLTDVTQASYAHEVWREYFVRPIASTTVGIKGLAVKDALHEVDLIAVDSNGPYRPEVIRTQAAPASPEADTAQAIKAGPFVFVSAQAPTDFVHAVAPEARTNPALPHFGRAIKQQTAYILDNVRAVLEAAGSSLDNVLKAMVFLVDMRDFLGLEEVWRTYFPTDPPARTVVPGVGLAPGGRVLVQVIGVAPDGHVHKEVVHTDRAPRPSIHQSQAIKAGDLVFLSGLMATDFQSPLAPAARVNPAFPNHDVSIKRQMEYVLDTADIILRAAGSSLDGVVRRQNYLTDFAGEMPAFREVTRARFASLPPASTTLEVDGPLVVPACTVLIDAMAIVPGA